MKAKHAIGQSGSMRALVAILLFSIVELWSLSAADTTYSFDDVTGDVPLNGIHGGIDFGAGNWNGGGNWFGLTGVGCYRNNVQMISFTLPAGRVLKNIKVSAGGDYNFTISDGVNPSISGSTVGFTPQAFTTGWTKVGAVVTITNTGTWDLVVDDIVYGEVAITNSTSSGSLEYGTMSVTYEGENARFLAMGAKWDRVFYLNAVSYYDDANATWTWADGANFTGSWSAGTGLFGLPNDRKYVVCMSALPTDLCSQQTWGATTGCSFPPDGGNWTGMYEYIRWVTGFLPANVKVVECINEPNAWPNGDGPHWRGTDAELVQYCETMAKAVHSLRPDIVVIAPSWLGLANPGWANDDSINHPDPGDPYVRIGTYIDLGLFSHRNETPRGVDGIGMHFYGSQQFSDAGSPDGITSLYFRKLLATLDNKNLGDLPMYVTEYGWSTVADGAGQAVATEAIKARHHARGLAVYGYDRRIKVLLPFALRGVDSWGFLETNNVPRASYTAIKTSIAQLEGADFIKWETNAARTFNRIQYTRGLDDVHVVWYRTGSGSYTIPSGTVVSVINLLGNAVTVGSGRITVGQDPIFVRVSNAPKLGSFRLLNVARGKYLTIDGSSAYLEAAGSTWKCTQVSGNTFTLATGSNLNLTYPVDTIGSQATLSGSVISGSTWRLEHLSGTDYFLRNADNPDVYLGANGVSRTPSGAEEARGMLFRSTNSSLVWTLIGPMVEIIPGTIHRTGGTVTFNLQTVQGVSNVVEYKKALTDVAWTTLTSFAGSGAIVPITDSDPLPTGRFYRALAVIP